MLAVYITSLALSIILYFILFVIDVKDNLFQHLMMIIIIFTNIGALLAYLSTNYREALLANKLVYLSGIFLPMLFFFCVCDVCHFRLRKRYELLLLGIQSVLYFLVCTTGFSDIYYKSVSYYVDNGQIILIKEYAPLHSLYIITMFAYFIASIALSIRASIKKNVVNHKDVLLMLLGAGVNLACFIIQKLLPQDIDLMSYAYIVLMCCTMYSLYRANVYDVLDNKNIAYDQLNSVGYITLNKKLEFMGCNEYAAEIFDELKDCHVGKKIDTISPNLGKIIDGVKRYSTVVADAPKKMHHHIKFSTINIEQKHYETKIHTIENIKNRCVGYTIEIVDNTTHYRVVELTTKYNDDLEKEVKEKTDRIRAIQDKTILGMAQMVESRDLSTGGHIRRTSDVVRIFADKLAKSGLGMSREFLNLVVRSAPMHDLGKIGVDDAILRKNGKFTPEEYEQMKTHSTIGCKMVKDILTDVEEPYFVQIAHNVAHYHHEKVNGTGYPEGLSGNAIPIEARIMALADVFDALVSKRCYKDAFSYDKAFQIIKEDSGSHFDATLAEIFLSCRPELEEYYNNSNTES